MQLQASSRSHLLARPSLVRSPARGCHNPAVGGQATLPCRLPALAFRAKCWVLSRVVSRVVSRAAPSVPSLPPLSLPPCASRHLLSLLLRAASSACLCFALFSS